MQFVERMPYAPAVLTDRKAHALRNRLFRFMTRGSLHVSQSKYFHEDIDLSDPDLTEQLNFQFRGRCAFCEMRTSVTPYRFRPASEALPYHDSGYGHMYYRWMDLAWQNFYSICPHCVPDEPGYFPVDGDREPLPEPELLVQFAESDSGIWPDYPLLEKAILLDPCLDKAFYRHFDVSPNGVMTGLSRRGQETISHFKLNQRRKISARRRAFRSYFERLLETMRSNAVVPKELFDFGAMQFGGTWYLLLRLVARELRGSFSSEVRSLSTTGILRFYQAAAKRRRNVRMLEDAWSALDVHGEASRPHLATQPIIPELPRLTGVEIRNYKSIEQAAVTLPPSNTAVDRCPSLLIIGENAAGKSSVLESIALAMLPRPALSALSSYTHELLLEPDYLGATTTSRPLTGRIVLTFSSGSSRVLRIEDSLIPGGRVDQQLPPIFAYGAFRQYQTTTDPNRTPSDYVRSLFDGSVLLPNPERWLLGLIDEEFAMVIRALRCILSIDGEFDVISRDLVSGRCDIVTATNGLSGGRHFSPLKHASSGFRSILAMACDVMQGLMNRSINPTFKSLESARAVVLIDEVEAHLHPRWKMQVMRGLRDALPNVTFIATSHDPLCLRGMEDGEIAVIRRVSADPGSSQFGLSSTVEVQVPRLPIGEYRIEQLLTSDLFHLYSTDDPSTDAELANIADLLAAPRHELTAEELSVVERFCADISSALPVGSSEAHRLVQEAVAAYLSERKFSTQQKLQALRLETRQKIAQILARST